MTDALTVTGAAGASAAATAAGAGDFLGDFFASALALLVAGALIALFNHRLNRKLAESNFAWQAHLIGISQLEKHCEKIRNLFGAWLEGKEVEQEIAAHINMLPDIILALGVDRSVSHSVKQEARRITGGDFGARAITAGERADKANRAIALTYKIQITMQNHLKDRLKK